MRFGLRSLFKTPGFTVLAVLTMALAIGACTALFSTLQAVVLRPLPYPEPDRLVSIWLNNTERQFQVPAVSWAKYDLFRARTDVFESIALAANNAFTLTEGHGEPEQVPGVHASANFLQVLGFNPSRGRHFTAEEDADGAAPVVMISHQLWQNRFGADPAIIGRVVQIDGIGREVIGLLPENLPVPFNNVGVLVPNPANLPFLTPAQRNNAIVHAAYARLAPGISLEAANRRLAEMVAQFRVAQPNHIDAKNDNELRTIEQQVLGNLGHTFWTLAGAVAAVLLIACANVTNLFLARVSTRQKEIAVRMSIGAGRKEIVHQFLTESVLFTAIAGIGGVLIASWSLRGIQLLAGPQLPRSEQITLDPTVLSFALIVTLLTGLLIGLYPAWQASRTDMHSVMKDAGRGAGGGTAAKAFRQILVVLQVAMSLTLLICAGLLVLSFHRLQNTELGFLPERRAMAQVNLPNARYNTPETTREFYRQLQRKLDEAPEVAKGGAIFGMPLTGIGAVSPYSVQGRPVVPVHERPLASLRYVTPGYFAAVGIRLQEGRFFTEQDRFGGEQVMLLNQTLARKLFPGESAVGQAFLLGPNSDVVVRIVGVIRDVKAAGLASPPPDEMYFPRDQRGGAFMTIVAEAQSGLSASALIPVFRRVVAEIDPALAVATPQTLEQLVEQNVGVQRLTMWLLITFAGLAATLAAVGLYSVLAYNVTQRTSEFGVRVALGASSGNILALVLRSGAIQVGLGLALGLGGALAASRLLREVLYEVRPFDPAVFLAVAAGFALVGGFACLIPARRAARVDPMIALRTE